MLRLPAGALLALMLMIVGAPVAPAEAAGAGKADGSLRLDKAQTALTNAYAIEVVEVPEMRMEGSPERTIMVLLTDRPMPEGRRVDDMAAMELAYDGKMRGLVLDIDPATGTVQSGRTLLPQEELPQFFSVAGDPPSVSLAGFAEDKAKGTVTGKVKTTEPMEIVNFDNRPGPKTFTFNVLFTAPLVAAPTLTATLEGDQAKDSEQGRLLKQFLQTVADGDAEKLRAIVTKDHPALSMLNPEGMAQIKEMMFADGSSVDQLFGLLTKIYVYENTAIALLRHSDGWSSFPLAREDGRWKMGY
ncbi:MAG TPA: nuclear transport factor 2 family protein [Hypericibacter adhaerens]|jgi:hypothetical protein|uniref:nuclear transport factor 2 family protein n=1 Tax=Hypericibacter adhaerens TaxID=2602016 RepID=UPI002D024072|nr:nuclear transport factor 2 family protein [Hypericibacter adhaerens]HWA41699.1 nuclear transport factor 2 family protein [Hypericibacter adhaerens]